MSKKSKIGLGAINVAKEAVNVIAIIAVLLLLIYGSFSIWDSRQVHVAASSANYTQFRPTEDNSLSFDELREINSEVFAWLTVFGTNIDYPIVQGDEQDNIKYVNTNVFLEFSPSGAIFMEWRNARDFSDFKSIFFGHHMARNVKFGEIANFHNEDYFNARKYGTLFFGGQTHGLEFFAFLHTHAYDDKTFNVSITDTAAKQQNLDYLLNLSIHIREDIDVTIEDRLLLLSTCSDESTNGRDILIARIIDYVPANPFETETPDANTIPVIGELAGLWARLSVAMKIIIIALPLLLTALVCIFIIKNKKRKNSRKYIGGSDLR